METGNSSSTLNNSNRLLIKGIITGGLILVMLIPTLFVSELAREREALQKQVVKEVSSKWSGTQRVSGIYLSVPYTENAISNTNQSINTRLILLPENLSVISSILPEEAHRSIYHVFLYRTQVQLKGNFNIHLTEDIQRPGLDFSKARLCIGITDFNGIEEKIMVKLGNDTVKLQPGLPTAEIDKTGLSGAVDANTLSTDSSIAFEATLKLKGSEQLHFVPLAANSDFTITSPWENPSFDGNTIPASRKVSENGFTATWKFNQANLPYTTIIKEGTLKNGVNSFGVSMLQPADQYGKTIRSIKYAILFIGLTFALFFIIEISQHQPVHPVQYVLIGLALIIFYTLLLSISEFVQFNLAYLIAAIATVGLITLYAKSHFRRWKTAMVFGGVLSALYTFIFVLISLEDTALLVGSIGLFTVLAAVMYASRKVNWYGTASDTETDN